MREKKIKTVRNFNFNQMIRPTNNEIPMLNHAARVNDKIKPTDIVINKQLINIFRLAAIRGLKN